MAELMHKLIHQPGTQNASFLYYFPADELHESVAHDHCVRPHYDHSEQHIAF